jgi:hypothetical protein
LLEPLSLSTDRQVSTLHRPNSDPTQTHRRRHTRCSGRGVTQEMRTALITGQVQPQKKGAHETAHLEADSAASASVAVATRVPARVVGVVPRCRRHRRSRCRRCCWRRRCRRRHPHRRASCAVHGGHARDAARTERRESAPTARRPLCAGRMARHHHTAAARLLRGARTRAAGRAATAARR